MKTIICGGRDYIFTMEDRAWLDAMRVSLPITGVFSGEAKGADTCGRNWAMDNRISVTLFPADWAKHGKAAGPIRNQQMADYADACIAFPGGAGTGDMVTRAFRKGLKVIMPYPEHRQRHLDSGEPLFP